MLHLYSINRISQTKLITLYCIKAVALQNIGDLLGSIAFIDAQWSVFDKSNQISMLITKCEALITLHRDSEAHHIIEKYLLELDESHPFQELDLAHIMTKINPQVNLELEDRLHRIKDFFGYQSNSDESLVEIINSLYNQNKISNRGYCQILIKIHSSKPGDDIQRNILQEYLAAEPLGYYREMGTKLMNS